MSPDMNCLSYWFPLLHRAGLPVPRTEILAGFPGLKDLLDGKRPEGWEAFLRALTDACDAMGYPAFLRTGQGSGKHQWEDTCYIPDAGVIPEHVANLVAWSEEVDMLGLPVDVWAVREMLPTVPIAHLPAYHGMPLVREFRCFVRDGAVECVHGYWPVGAIENGFRGHDIPYFQTGRSPVAIFGTMASCYTDQEYCEILHLAERAGQALPGFWSVDILDTQRGWFITDCALGERSFHHPECQRRRLDPRPLPSSTVNLLCKDLE